MLTTVTPITGLATTEGEDGVGWGIRRSVINQVTG